MSLLGSLIDTKPVNPIKGILQYIHSNDCRLIMAPKNREHRRAIAKQTLEIIDKGEYEVEGEVVSVREEIGKSVEGSRCRIE